jgi:hypothetical protein
LSLLSRSARNHNLFLLLRLPSRCWVIINIIIRMLYLLWLSIVWRSCRGGRSTLFFLNQTCLKSTSILRGLRCDWLCLLISFPTYCALYSWILFFLSQLPLCRSDDNIILIVIIVCLYEIVEFFLIRIHHQRVALFLQLLRIDRRIQ